jgi:hypothetical protein
MTFSNVSPGYDAQETGPTFTMQFSQHGSRRVSSEGALGVPGLKEAQNEPLGIAVETVGGSVPVFESPLPQRFPLV